MGDFSLKNSIIGGRGILDSAIRFQEIRKLQRLL